MPLPILAVVLGSKFFTLIGTYFLKKAFLKLCSRLLKDNYDEYLGNATWEAGTDLFEILKAFFSKKERLCISKDKLVVYVCKRRFGERCALLYDEEKKITLPMPSQACIEKCFFRELVVKEVIKKKADKEKEEGKHEKSKFKRTGFRD